MAYTLGQVVSRVFDRSFGAKAQNAAPPRPAMAPVAAAVRNSAPASGVVVTLSPQARQILSELRSQQPAVPNAAPPPPPRMMRALDVSI